jgi:hypothetical protein
MTDDLGPDEMQRLRDAIDTLPASIEPARDVWPAIRDRIEAQRVRPISASAVATPPRSSRRGWLAAAAVVLVVGSSAITMRVMRPDVPPVVLSPVASSPVVQVPSAPPAPTIPDPPTTHVSRVSAAAIFDRYDAAASDLSIALQQRRGQLDPTTVAVLDSCLARIDIAIAEARRALKQAPQNSVITEILTTSYQQKLDLLKRAGDLPVRGL